MNLASSLIAIQVPQRVFKSSIATSKPASSSKEHSTSPILSEDQLGSPYNRRMHITLLKHISATSTLIFGASTAFLAAAITLDPKDTPRPGLLFISCIILLVTILLAIFVSSATYLHSTFLESSRDQLTTLPAYNVVVVQPPRPGQIHRILIYLYLVTLLLVITVLGVGCTMLLVSRKSPVSNA